MKNSIKNTNLTYKSTTFAKWVLCVANFLMVLLAAPSISYAVDQINTDISKKNLCIQQLSGQLLINCNTLINQATVSSMTVTYLTAANFTISSTSFNNFTATNSTLTYLTSTRADINTVKASSITTTFFTTTDSTATSMTSGLLTTTNLKATSAVVTNLSVTDSTSTSLTATNVVLTNVKTSSDVVTNFTATASTTTFLKVTTKATVPNGSLASDAASYGQLIMLQAPVQGTITASTSTTTTVFANTTLTATITPTSTSSRIKITSSGILQQNTIAKEAYMTISRGGTNVAGSNGLTSLYPGNAGTGVPFLAPYSISYIDSPATTSATTYTIQIRTDSGGTAQVGDGANSTSVIILEEIR